MNNLAQTLLLYFYMSMYEYVFAYRLQTDAGESVLIFTVDRIK